MYKQNRYQPSSIQVNDSTEGETIEQKIERIVNNGEPITDGAPLVYTERSEGVLPQYDPRADRFEIAIEATDIIQKTHMAKREERIKALEEMRNPKESPEAGDSSGTSSQQ